MYKTDFISLYEELSTLNESELVEAFEYLTVDSKTAIIDKLKALGYYVNGTIAFPLARSSFSNTKTLVDFNVVTAADGNGMDIEVVVRTRYQDPMTRNVSERIEHILLERFIATEPRGRALDFARALRDAARELNRELRPNLIQRRNQNTAQALAPQEVADLFQQHVTNIKFVIPHPAGSSFDSSDLPNLEDLDQYADAAVENLERIYTDFYDLEFAEAAYDAGMVINRKIADKTIKNIATQWHLEGRVTFDTPIKDLPQEMIDVILAARSKNEAAPNTSARTVSCYRLAKELIIRFNNDINFFR